MVEEKLEEIFKKRGIFSYHDERGEYFLKNIGQGKQPLCTIFADNIPCAWELAVLSCWNHGVKIPTHYDREGDPPSIESTIVVNISSPFSEPRIHKNFPGGPEALEVYRQEVVYGIHDHWLDPKEKKWTYTYHDRIFNWNLSFDLNADNLGRILNKGINQIEEGVLKPLVKDITTKGAQAITWFPTADPSSPGDRPCLQHLWWRVLKDENKELVLNLETLWRSRDLYKAWFMNVYALTDLQREVAGILSHRIGKNIKIGNYTDISNSLHIYGQDYSTNKFKSDIEKMENQSIFGDKKRDIPPRVYYKDDPGFKFGTEETIKKLKEDVDYMKKIRFL